MKFVPFTLIVLFGGNTPTGVLDGESEVIVGIGLFAALIVNVAACKEDPPGNGFTTVICGKPVFAMYAAGMVTESCVVLALNETGAQAGAGGADSTQLPFQKICEVAKNPTPEAVNKKDAPPAKTPSGEIEVIIGVGVNVGPLLLQQFRMRIETTADKASAVRRKRINPSLL